jgi:hypothetical protein
MTTRRKILAIATFVGTAVLLSVVVTYPQAVSDPTLGSDWQCHRTLFVTSCTRAEQPVPTAQNLRMERIRPRRV